MGRIAEALAQVAGQRARHRPHRQPADPRSARFPSNWHLSEERARNVRDLLVAHRSRPTASAPKAAPTPSRSAERHRQPTAREPARRDHAVRRPPATRRARSRAARQMIAKLLGLVFNRWVLLAVLLLAVSLVVWIVGPLIGLPIAPAGRGSRSSPSRRAGSRSASIAAADGDRRRLARAGARKRGNTRRRQPAAWPQPRGRSQGGRERRHARRAAALREGARSRCAGPASAPAAASSPAGRRKLGRPLPLRAAVVHVHRRAGLGQDDGAAPTRASSSRSPTIAGEDAIRGVGGTRNCDWWFTDEAVLIDTAGRYTTQDSDRENDRAPGAASWRCSSARGRASRSTACWSRSRVRPARRARRRARASTPPPCASACRSCTSSSACAFRSTCWSPRPTCSPASPSTSRRSTRTSARRPWGATFPRRRPARRRTWQRFGQRVRRARSSASSDGLVERLQPSATRRSAPASTASRPVRGAARRRCRNSSRSAFSPSPYEAEPLLRGVYFTSGTQEGTPIDRVLGSHRAQLPPRARDASRRTRRAARATSCRACSARSCSPRAASPAPTSSGSGAAPAAVVAGYAAIARAHASARSPPGLVSYVEQPALRRRGRAARRTRAPAGAGDAQPRLARPAAAPAGAGGDAQPRRRRAAKCRVTLGFRPLPGPQARQRRARQPTSACSSTRAAAHRPARRRAAAPGEQRDRDAVRGAQDLPDAARRAALRRRGAEALPRRRLGRAVRPLAHRRGSARSSTRTSTRCSRKARRCRRSPRTRPWSLHRARLAARAAAAAHLRPHAPAGPRQRLPRVHRRCAPPATTRPLVFARASGQPLTKGVPGLFTYDGYHKGFQKAVKRRRDQLADEQGWVLGVDRSRRRTRSPRSAAASRCSTRCAASTSTNTRSAGRRSSPTSASCR